MQLVRQSWKNRPLSVEEARHLHSIHALSNHTPGLRLLVKELLCSAQQLSHLYPGTAAFTGTADAPTLAADLDARSSYRQQAQASKNLGWMGFERSPRALLTCTEQMRVLGCFHEQARVPLWIRQMREGRGLLDVPPCGLAPDIVASIEAQLRALVVSQPPPTTAPPPYPLLGAAPLSSEDAALQPQQKKRKKGGDCRWWSGGEARCVYPACPSTRAAGVLCV